MVQRGNNRHKCHLECLLPREDPGSHHSLAMIQTILMRSHLQDTNRRAMPIPILLQAEPNMICKEENQGLKYTLMGRHKPEGFPTVVSLDLTRMPKRITMQPKDSKCLVQVEDRFMHSHLKDSKCLVQAEDRLTHSRLEWNSLRIHSHHLGNLTEREIHTAQEKTRAVVDVIGSDLLFVT